MTIAGPHMSVTLQKGSGVGIGHSVDTAEACDEGARALAVRPAHADGLMSNRAEQSDGEDAVHNEQERDHRIGPPKPIFDVSDRRRRCAPCVGQSAWR